MCQPRVKKELCEIGEEAVWESRFTFFFYFVFVLVSLLYTLPCREHLTLSRKRDFNAGVKDPRHESFDGFRVLKFHRNRTLTSVISLGVFIRIAA